MKTELALLLIYEQPTMTLEQVATLMEITPRSLENQHYAQRCPIPLFKVGSKLQAHISDVAAHIDAQRAGALELLQQRPQPA
jgi:hypothetical protein